MPDESGPANRVAFGDLRLIPILFDASELFAFVLYFMCIQAGARSVRPSLLSQAG